MRKTERWPYFGTFQYLGMLLELRALVLEKNVERLNTRIIIFITSSNETNQTSSCHFPII